MKKIIACVMVFAGLVLNAQEVTKQYDKIEKFDQGVAVMWHNGKCGLVSQTGKEIIKPQYDNIGRFGRDGIAYTHKNGLMGLINMTGKVIVDNIYGDIGRFNGPWAITRKNGLAGMINKQGKVLIENKYELIKVEKGGVIRGVIQGKEVLLSVEE